MHRVHDTSQRHVTLAKLVSPPPPFFWLYPLVVADEGKRDLTQLRALDPVPVLGDVRGASSILNCILKLAPATPIADICSRSVLRAAEPDLRGQAAGVAAN